jgi:hypothetical protein
MANSKRKCAYCKERVRDYIVVNTQAFCSFDEAVKYGIENKPKGAAIAKKAADKKHAKRKKAFNDNDKALREKSAQSACNAYIRKRDEGELCISCKCQVNFNSYVGGSGVNAGHFKSRGGHASLRFEELNIHVQCFRCNVHLSGNVGPYRENLIDKIGLEKVEWLEGPHEPKKYSCEELKAIELLYKQKLKEML